MRPPGRESWLRSFLQSCLFRSSPRGCDCRGPSGELIARDAHCCRGPRARGHRRAALGITLWQTKPPAFSPILRRSSSSIRPRRWPASWREAPPSSTKPRGNSPATFAILEPTSSSLQHSGLSSCDADDSPLDELVSIGHDRAGRIAEEARADAGRPAQPRLRCSQRNRPTQSFQDERRRLLVITAGLDDCGGDLSEVARKRGSSASQFGGRSSALGLSADEKEELLGPSGRRESASRRHQ